GFERSDKPRRKREDAREEWGRANDGEAFDRPRAPRREFSRDPSNTGPVEPGMERFRIEVGHAHEVKPANIVGAIANEAGIESRYIGRIQIFDEFSYIDLPEGMPKETFQHLQRVWVQKRQLRITKIASGAAG